VFSTVATGVSGTSWTSGTLANGYNYYYEVTAVAGSWSSAASTPYTPRRYVAGGACS
jgi:hypothetical protein